MIEVWVSLSSKTTHRQTGIPVIQRAWFRRPCDFVVKTVNCWYTPKIPCKGLPWFVWGIYNSVWFCQCICKYFDTYTYIIAMLSSYNQPDLSFSDAMWIVEIMVQSNCLLHSWWIPLLLNSTIPTLLVSKIICPERKHSPSKYSLRNENQIFPQDLPS